MGAVPTQTQSPDYCGNYLNWAYTVYIQDNWFPGVTVHIAHMLGHIAHGVHMAYILGIDSEIHSGYHPWDFIPLLNPFLQ